MSTGSDKLDKYSRDHMYSVKIIETFTTESEKALAQRCEYFKVSHQDFGFNVYLHDLSLTVILEGVGYDVFVVTINSGELIAKIKLIGDVITHTNNTNFDYDQLCSKFIIPMLEEKLEKLME